MNILFLLSIGFDRQATSGHLLTAIIEALCDGGHNVHIIQKDTGGDLPSIPKELAQYNITTTSIPFQAVDKDNFVARYLNELKYFKACSKHIDSGYEAVFIQSNTVAGFAVRVVKKKLPEAIITFNVQDIFPYNAVYGGKLKEKSVAFKVLSSIQRYAYNKSDHIITISDDMRDLLVEDGVPAEKIEVVYNWSYQDEPYENIDKTSVSHLFNHSCFNVVYAGNIGVMQNVDIIIEAARLMKNDKDIWFYIIGNGIYKDKLEKRAKEYEIENISFWPMQSSELAPAIYSAADVNVIPLVKAAYRTALPSKTATCMACRKPIIFAIGKDSKFAKKAMEEADCTLVESDNAEELIEAIRNVRLRKQKNRADDFFLKYCRKTENSRKYAELITRGARS